MGQLQVVARHTDTSPSSCYGPVLIPGCYTIARKTYHTIGSVKIGSPRIATWDQKEKSLKPKASSLTAGPGYDRMDLERINYDTKTSTRKNKNSG